MKNEVLRPGGLRGDRRTAMASTAAAAAAAAAPAAGATDIRKETGALFASIGLLSEVQAKDLEIGIYNGTISYAREKNVPLTWKSDAFREVYLAKARAIYVNLKKDGYVGNTRLSERLQDGEFTPHELGQMRAEHLYPEKWADIVQKEIMKSQAAYEVNVVAMSDRIWCGKCKKNKVTYYEQQTRSADEACTIFYQCLNCGHRWKN